MSKPEDHPKPAPAGDENFLLRWARRKEAARAGKSLEEETGGPAAAPPAPADERPAPEGVGAEGAASAAPELPPLDSLTEESDFSAFMQAGVSPDLKRQALRKLFQGAKYATLDPLDPFRADFREYLPLGDIVTADMKFHAERLLREQLEKAAGQSEGRLADGRQAGADPDSRTDPAEARGEEPEQAEDDDDERRDA